MAELTDVLYAKATDASPSATDFLFTYDAETGTLKKVLIPDGIAVAAVLKTLADAKGDLIVASAADVFGRLPAGSDGQMLYVDSAQSLGVKWAAPPSGSGIVAGIMDAKGDLLGATGNDTPARVPVGTDGHMLYSDSAEALGIRWGAPPSGTGIAPTIMDAKGDLLGASAADTPIRVAVGSNGQILVADSSQAAGLLWQNHQGKVTSITSSATPAADAADAQYNITAAAAGMTIGAVTGSPSDGQKLIYRFKDNGTARSIVWNAIYRAIGITLPTTTVIGKVTYVGYIYNSADTKWDGVATVTQA